MKANLNHCYRQLGCLLLATTVTVGLTNAQELPSRKIKISDFSYQGAFALPADQLGESSLNYAKGTIQVSGKKLFIAGLDVETAVGQFRIPKLKRTKNLSKLKLATPVQSFIRLPDRAAAGNPETLDTIMGMESVGKKLIVNLMEYYDAPEDNVLTTLVIKNSAKLGSSQISAFHRMKGRAKAAGWISPIPREWQSTLGGKFISGNSSGLPIIGRLSVGPSAFATKLPNKLVQTQEHVIKTTQLQGYSLNNPLHTDLHNDSGNNDLWTHLSSAEYGFIVPGTRTYVTVGSSGGHKSGITYKKVFPDGYECPGYCANDLSDVYNYYWLWDLRDWQKVKSGAKKPHQIRPYDHGKFNVPFQTDPYLNKIGGASYDADTGLLYLSVLRANTTLGEYNNPPVIVAYRIN